MSLIDFDAKDSEQKKVNNNDIFCKDCNKKLIVNSPILLCENCFNENTKNTLNLIIQNIWKINNELKNVKNTIQKINEELRKDNLHIIVVNKLEIDLINFKAIEEKLLIDKKLNQDAFEINQIQANKLRKEMNWTLFEIKDIENVAGGIKNE